MSKEYKTIINISGKEVEVSLGKIAMQSHGAIMLKMGGTTLFATANVGRVDAGLDYFPLSVEYIEKMYARGAMSGSRFRKREGLPSDEATIKAREVDHSIRSLFPKSFKRAVSVVLTVLSYDGINDPQSLTVLGASLALMQAGLPFYGPCSSVVVCLDESNQILINPSAEGRDKLKAEFIISGVDNKILSFEGWGKEVAEETMEQILDKANEEIVKINKQQTDFMLNIPKTLNINPEDYDNKPAPENLINMVKDKQYDSIKEALFNNKIDRNERIRVIKDELIEELTKEDSTISALDIDLAVEYVARRILRDAVLSEDKRVSGRQLNEIRELTAEIDILPTVHGSALFSRGMTQTLSIITLASQSNELLIDDMEGETTKGFMHHYNFPPFSTGEAGRYSYHPGRREVGHGAIGENALKNVIPSQEEFPYTIRAVSETMSSNGSTSMAATCASSLALMAAGVPIKEQVAGIGVGLVTEDDNEDNYKLLMDIEGIEDFYGDMDFKVCGTKNGITAIQYENKLRGVKLDVIKEAFKLAKQGRTQVLEVMNKVISEPRKELAENAPKVEKINIEQSRIGELIGPSGKNIKSLIEMSGEYAAMPADINIEDDGTVVITAANQTQMEFVKSKITNMFKKAEVGETYDGVVDKIMTYGLFVNVSQSITGLCHVSEVGEGFVKDLNEKFKEGQSVRVKVIKITDDGKVNFTMKGVEQPTEEKK